MANLSDEDIRAGQSSQPVSPVEQLFSKLSGMQANNQFTQPFFPVYQESVAWYRAQQPQKAVTVSPRGERLRADQILAEKPSPVWVICLHGFTNTPRELSPVAKGYHAWGYNLLLPHLCGHGESESDTVSMGWLDRLDVLGWIDYLNREYGDPQIILHGISMGAATAMMATGEALPSNVLCAIADCGFTSFWDFATLQAKALFHIGPFPALYALDTVGRLRLGFSLKEVSCLEQLKQSKTPTLFIHGDQDSLVPFWMLQKLYDAAACEKEMLVVPGAEHAESMYHTELYYGTIRRFIDRYL